MAQQPPRDIRQLLRVQPRQPARTTIAQRPSVISQEDKMKYWEVLQYINGEFNNARDTGLTDKRIMLEILNGIQYGGLTDPQNHIVFELSNTILAQYKFTDDRTGLDYANLIKTTFETLYNDTSVFCRRSNLQQYEYPKMRQCALQRMQEIHNYLKSEVNVEKPIAQVLKEKALESLQALDDSKTVILKFQDGNQQSYTAKEIAQLYSEATPTKLPFEKCVSATANFCIDQDISLLKAPATNNNENNILYMLISGALIQKKYEDKKITELTSNELLQYFAYLVGAVNVMIENDINASDTTRKFAQMAVNNLSATVIKQRSDNDTKVQNNVVTFSARPMSNIGVSSTHSRVQRMY